MGCQEDGQQHMTESRNHVLLQRHHQISNRQELDILGVVVVVVMGESCLDGLHGKRQKLLHRGLIVGSQVGLTKASHY